MIVTRTRVKICGITNEQDAKSVAAAGADAIGLVFYEQSPRAVDIQQAQAICATLPAFVSKVGLFVNAKVVDVETALEFVDLDYLQFHGDESAEYCASFAKPYIKALRIKSNEHLVSIIEGYQDSVGILLDSYDRNSFGGTGQVFDWDIIPFDLRSNIILAGGLNSQNVCEAIDRIDPYAVDVSSGVEAKPGCKSVEKIDEFMRQVSHADTSRANKKGSN